MLGKSKSQPSHVQPSVWVLPKGSPMRYLKFVSALTRIIAPFAISAPRCPFLSLVGNKEVKVISLLNVYHYSLTPHLYQLFSLSFHPLYSAQPEQLRKPASFNTDKSPLFLTLPPPAMSNYPYPDYNIAISRHTSVAQDWWDPLFELSSPAFADTAFM